jgi:hypothetical protein
MAGQSVICPTCGTPIVVPAGDTASAPPPLPGEPLHAPPVAAAALEPLPWETQAPSATAPLGSRILEAEYKARLRKRFVKNLIAFALGIVTLIVVLVLLTNVGK